MPLLSEAYDNNTLKPTIKIIQSSPTIDDHNHLLLQHPVQQDPIDPDLSSQNINQPKFDNITALPMPKEGTKATQATARLMKKAWSAAQVTHENIRVHVDGGANRSITNNKDQ